MAIAISGFMCTYHNKSQGRENINYLLRLLLSTLGFSDLEIVQKGEGEEPLLSHCVSGWRPLVAT